ncbi:uncharacterized protein [Onthophagus taurus]|uniref:uncharacterized protein n=1 Tax=Onthophagus taurus TaxID=166361 RepID=UPI0039BE57CA
MELSVYYQNVRGLRSKTNTLFLKTSDSEFDFVCLTETYLNSSVHDGELFGAQYTVFRRDRESTLSSKKDGGGVLIAIRSTIDCFRLAESASAEDLWLSVQCGGTRLLLCCVYLPPADFDSLDAFLVTLHRVCDHYPDHKILIFGDFNLPHISWYSSQSLGLLPSSANDARSRLFLTSFSYCNFEQFNGVRNANDRTLDLILSNSHNISDFSQSLDPLLHADTHHPALTFSIKFNLLHSLCENCWRKYLFHKANYTGIRTSLASVDWGAAISHLPVDEALEVFYSVVRGAVDEFIPHKITFKCRFPNWYSLPTIKAIKEKLKFHKKWKTTADYKLYLEATQTSLSDNPNSLWSFIKSRKKGSMSIPSKISYGDRVVEGGEEICKLFVDYFSSAFVDGTLVDIRDCSSSEIAPWFLRDDILQALSLVNPRAGAGPDGLPGVLFRQILHNPGATPLFSWQVSGV